MDERLGFEIRQDPLGHFDSSESECVVQYIAMLRDRLGDRLLEVHLYGSFARGDFWNSASPMHSDVDLLILCSEMPSEPQIEEFLNATYPLFLECGRQISPYFQTREAFETPTTPVERAFRERLRDEGQQLFPEGKHVAI